MRAATNEARDPTTTIVQITARSSRSTQTDDLRASIRALRRTFATLMFLDIVDSTAHATRLGDRHWLDLLERYEHAATEAIRRFRGHVLSTAGDGLVARFSTATAGVLCAARITATATGLGLEVRSGLHAGECERRSRQLGGLAFHVGARIAALAEPGQIMLSQTVADLMLGSGLDVAPMGPRTLKGLSTPWAVYTLLSREASLPQPAA